MRNIIYFILLFTLAGCESREKKFSLIGKWELIETHEFSYIAKRTIQIKPKEEKFFIFKNNNVVVDENGNIGIYKLNGNRLFISSFNQHYLLKYRKEDTDRMELDFTNSEYASACDEGCTEVYEKE
ncbi:MAG: hypothetical protein M0D53_01875 [Flavobacterium sp. JAD_PAG50586_2]|nr:MAG: hypothetical protein M0D53_01875 [Flavobacterium sp. JAD_PAG50586_2]